MKTWADFNIDIPEGATGHTRTTCPSCSDSRQKKNDKCLSVDMSDQAFFCHHCGYKGSLNGKDVDTEKYQKPKFDPKTLLLPDKAVKWFKSRGISPETLSAEKIGYGQSFPGKMAVQYPYVKGGVVVNIKHRAGDKSFRQEKNAEKCLYRFDEIAKGKGTLIITEGEMDALSFVEAKFNTVTSIPDGAPSVDAKQFHSKFDFLKSAEKVIAQYDKVVLAVDNDGPGQLVEKELCRRIGAEKCYRVEYPDGCKDANDVLVKHGWESIRRLIVDAKPMPVEGLFCANDFKRELCLLYEQGSRPGVSTGWLKVDPYYTVRTGEFTVVTGIPGAGKSNWIDALCVNMIKEHEWRFLFFSPENWPVERHIQSLIEKLEMKPFAKHGRYTERMNLQEVKDSLRIIKDYCHFLYPQNSEIMTVDTILAKAKVAIFRHGIKGVVIDPWNEIDHIYDNMTEAQYLSKCLSKIRQFCKLNGVHIWVVAHPRNLTKDKDGNYKPPTMYEISGGAHWRNKADNGLCLFRPDYERSETELYIQKIRFKEVGQVGKVDLKYLSDCGCYDA